MGPCSLSLVVFFGVAQLLDEIGAGLVKIFNAGGCSSLFPLNLASGISSASFIIFKPNKMTYSMTFISTNLHSLVLNHHKSFRTLISPSIHKRYPKRLRSIRAVQETEGPRRLIDIIRSVPQVSRNYFRRPSRRTLFGGISLLGGFYVAQTISLSFGALGVNDVIAAVICVLLTEYVTRFYYSRPIVTFPLALLNNFKMGFTYGLFIDAFKLAS